MYSTLRHFHKCQARMLKFGGNIADKCGNPQKKSQIGWPRALHSGDFLIKIVLKYLIKDEIICQYLYYVLN